MSNLLHLRITNRGAIEQLFPGVGKVSHPAKRQTKQTRGRFKNIDRRVRPRPKIK